MRPNKPYAMADLEGISAILDDALGRGGWTFHEIMSDEVHLDVLVYPPTERRPTYVLVTCGMSALPMPSPEGHSRFAELCIELPPTWPLTIEAEALKDERNYWPIRLVKVLARFPHHYHTWLGPGHTIPNGNPAAPYADSTKLCCALLMPPMLLPEAIRKLPVPENLVPEDSEEFAELLQIVPIHRYEMEHRLEYGLESLLERLADNRVDPVVTPDRRDCCAPQ